MNQKERRLAGCETAGEGEKGREKTGDLTDASAQGGQKAELQETELSVGAVFCATSVDCECKIPKANSAPAARTRALESGRISDRPHSGGEVNITGVILQCLADVGNVLKKLLDFTFQPWLKCNWGWLVGWLVGFLLLGIYFFLRQHFLKCPHEETPFGLLFPP